MSSPVRELERLDFDKPSVRSSDEEGTVFGQEQREHHTDGSLDSRALHDRLKVETQRNMGAFLHDDMDANKSPSQAREEASRLNDEINLMRAEKAVSAQLGDNLDSNSARLHRSRSRNPEPVDEFDAATNPIHEKTQIYKPPENPSTKVARFFKYIHGSSWLVRYFTYIMPVFALLLIPVLMGALLPAGQNASVGGVALLWFGVWLEIVWLTLWGGRIIAKMIPYPLGLISSLFTNNAKKWRDLGKQLEVPATLFFWWLGIEVSFLPCMKNHHVNGDKTTKPWENTVNKIIISVFVGVVLNFVEKIIIQLIAISFHLRTYADRIDINKFQIGSLTKLYVFSKAKIAMEDKEFEEKTPQLASGARTPAIYADRAQGAINKAFAKVGDVAGAVAGDFTGKTIVKSGHPTQVVLTLLNSTSGSQILARRLYRTFVRDGSDVVISVDLTAAFDNEEEADAAFSMFDKDMNGDISMDELESVCVEIGRERKSITASLKDLDSVVSRLDDVLFFVVCVIFVLVLISLISTSAAGVLTSAGSAVLALSWLFSATAQEFLQSCIFVFVKHPFDVGDRVSIYGNTGALGRGDDYFVKEISLLYTEFKKMEGQVVQAPNSYLNTLFILNMRRSGGLAEALPIVIRFGTTLEQIEALRHTLLAFVKNEKREFQDKILTELRDVTEAYSLTLNVVFFYKSNWQNELLRLQRRNKFICALMCAMQEIGIEGPRRNQAGWRSDAPMYLQGYGAPPQYASAPSDNTQPPPTAASNDSDAIRTIVPATINHPSIMRQPASNTRAGRSESVSQISKRVDFSLGMKDVSSGDFLSDMSDDPRAPSRFREVIRESNEIDDQRKIEELKADRQAAASASGRSTSHDGGPRKSDDAPNATGIFRRGTGMSVASRSSRDRNNSVSSGGTHKNRFLSRLGHTGRRSFDIPHESLAEEGTAPPIDPRSGYVGTQAVRMMSAQSIQPDYPLGTVLTPTESRARDFAARFAPQSQPQ